MGPDGLLAFILLIALSILAVLGAFDDGNFPLPAFGPVWPELKMNRKGIKSQVSIIVIIRPGARGVKEGRCPSDI